MFNSHVLVKHWNMEKANRNQFRKAVLCNGFNGEEGRSSVRELSKWADRAQIFTIAKMTEKQDRKEKEMAERQWYKLLKSAKSLKTISSHHSVLFLCSSVP